MGSMQLPDFAASWSAGAYVDHAPPHRHYGPVPSRSPAARSGNPGRAAGRDDDHAENWRPLTPHGARSLTPAQRRAILDDLYTKSFIVYDRLAEL